MIACLDAAYGDAASAAACVLAAAWEDRDPVGDHTLRAGAPAAYAPGRFYLRELPLLIGVLSRVSPMPEVIVIDGYVWLDASHRPGLGAHLHAALGGTSAVVGVAKSAFADAAAWSAPVLRGASARPLYVTALGIDVGAAAHAVASMYGAHRMPNLLRRADTLARAAL